MLEKLLGCGFVIFCGAQKHTCCNGSETMIVLVALKHRGRLIVRGLLHVFCSFSGFMVLSSSLIKPPSIRDHHNIF